MRVEVVRLPEFRVFVSLEPLVRVLLPEPLLRVLVPLVRVLVPLVRVVVLLVLLVAGERLVLVVPEVRTRVVVVASLLRCVVGVVVSLLRCVLDVRELVDCCCVAEVRELVVLCCCVAVVRELVVLCCAGWADCVRCCVGCCVLVVRVDCVVPLERVFVVRVLVVVRDAPDCSTACCN